MEKFLFYAALVMLTLHYADGKKMSPLHKRSKRSLANCHFQWVNCNRINSKMAVHFENVSATALIPVIPENTLDSICQIYREMDACTRTFLSQPMCYTYVTYLFNHVTYQEYNDTYHFLCHEAREEYLESSSCFANPQVIQKEATCTSTYKQEMSQLNSMRRDPYYIKDKLCKNIDNYLNCLEHGTEQICNKTAALWLRALYTKNMKPTYENIGCKLNTTSYQHFTGASSTTTLASTISSMSSTFSSSSSGVTISSTVISSTTSAVMPGKESHKNGRHDYSPISNDAVVGSSIALAILVCGVVAALIIKFKYGGRKATYRQEGTNNNSIPTVYNNSLASPVILYSANGGNGTLGGDLPSKINPFDSIPNEKGAPPPTYSHINFENPLNDDLDNRNTIMSPPPPYAPPMEDDFSYNGIPNPLYEIRHEERIANVD